MNLLEESSSSSTAYFETACTEHPFFISNNQMMISG
jgi:hypothetical protein